MKAGAKYTRPERDYVNTMAAEEAEARKLGLSYGMYTAYRDTRYLKTYIRNREREEERDVNIIESNLIEGKRGGKTNLPGKKLG